MNPDNFSTACAALLWLAATYHHQLKFNNIATLSSGYTAALTQAVVSDRNLNASLQRDENRVTNYKRESEAHKRKVENMEKQLVLLNNEKAALEKQTKVQSEQIEQLSLNLSLNQPPPQASLKPPPQASLPPTGLLALPLP